MAWQPQEEMLQRVMHLFKGVHESYADILLNLEELNEVSDFNNYLMFLFTKLTSEDERIRSMSGLILKNNFIIHYKNLPPTVTEYLKSECLTAVGDTSLMVRKTVAIVTSTIASRNINTWPELLPALCQMLDSADCNVCEGALRALLKIFESSPEYLKDVPQNKLDILIPKFLQLFTHIRPVIRSHAMECVNQFILQKTPSLMNNIDVLLENVIRIIACHEEVEVRKSICTSIGLLLEVSMDRLVPHLHNIIEGACEFWLSIANQQICKEVLKPYLPRLVSILVNKTIYSKAEIQFLKGNVEEDDSDQENDDDSGVFDWNLRKSSAAALDALSNVFKEDFVPIFMPIVRERLSCDEWEVRECGILALGIIAEGCMNGIIPHLNKFIPYMIDHLSEKKALLRTIICWTLSRYSHWVVSQPHEQYLESVMHGLLKQISDSNKMVQKAACSAFVILEEEASTELLPYLGLILQTLVFALNTFQHKNVSIVYRAIETLADSVGHNLNKPEHINLLLPPLIQKWNVLKDEDEDLFPLFQCLSSIDTALQSGLMPDAEPVLGKCIQLVEQTKIS